ncbi:MAG: DNA-3-methyladenine glycosylase 2 family protein [Nitratireductor sp.]|nr:DNA-3-methyladenine glycosylase 2 family protein [Nitratireductor sp.]
MTRIRTSRDIATGKRHLRKACSSMAAMLEVCPAIPLRLTQPGFAGLASIIVSQQVSKASADAIFGRLRAAVDPLDAAGYLSAGETAWIAAGLSRPKQRTLTAISEAVLSGALDLDALCELPPETAIERMTAIKGIGPWTAEVYLMFCAGHRDVFPAGDLALQEAIRLADGLETRPTEKESRLRAEAWAPWRSVAARILWAYYAVEKRREAVPVA